MRRAVAASVAACAAPAACAHTAGTWTGWTFETWVVLPLAIAAMLYTVGRWRLRARSGARPATWHRDAYFAAGWTITALALVSPVHAAGSRSFAMHMFEHELLMLGGAPLLVLGRPLPVMLWAFPHGARRVLGRLTLTSGVSATWSGLTHPAVATMAQAVALWLWHAPALFGLALAGEGWHVLQHLSFMVTALLFWASMLDEARMRRHPMSAVVGLFFTALVSGALGALMAFSASPWYVGYARLGMTPFGLTPVEDQQLAGLLMWIPGGVVHAAAALAIVGRLLRGAPAPEVVPDAD
ncbi:cytochrome c oxidase assembly protein [Luteibacter sp. NPDC031894]|uniref:cytochrome c oxidase assembly protein n=1 Tax=Luteibacter sp. NPDC031894 TaxID=3390572 RepID=UPI003D018C48